MNDTDKMPAGFQTAILSYELKTPTSAGYEFTGGRLSISHARWVQISAAINDIASPSREPSVWRVVTPQQKNVFFVESAADAKKWEDQGYEVRALAYIENTSQGGAND